MKTRSAALAVTLSILWMLWTAPLPVVAAQTTGAAAGRASGDTSAPAPQAPARQTTRLTRTGSNDCADLPKPPEGVPGLREYARVAIHHDGILEVTAAQLPFSNNPGYVYREVNGRWEANESDYILLRSPIPVLGGYTYILTFGGDEDRCGPWSIDATVPE